ncbi:DUF1761 domain-containing protein [Blastococcus sp. TBT05-19]|uniref:DUF1761 domain-containing protein n=1 Tax=Blastococcus sp. TBT05-19 TaxID=2250581 RepID=UPI0011BF849D|nr:DUF1761 domain-containing protein [Blastococcus sp. TBT05-19]
MVAVAVVVASVLAFVASSVYYAVTAPIESRILGDRALDRGRPAPWKVAAELLRTAVVAGVFAGIAERADLLSLPGCLLLALVLWVGFPAVLLTGSVTWEKVPPVTAAMHAGDWLLKLLLIGAVVGALQ